MPERAEPAQSARASETLSDPHWTFDCMDYHCGFDTYGGHDIYLLAREHVARTGHTVHMRETRDGLLRPDAKHD